MKRTLLLILIIASATIARAQQTLSPKRSDPNADISIPMPVNDNSKVVTEEDPSKIYTEVEQAPTFVGGMDKFYDYLHANVRYPASAKANNTEGKVFVAFVVEKDGSFTDIKVLRGLSPDCDVEAIRLIKMCPHWRPGIRNGRPVRVAYTIPINFELPDKN